MRLLRCGSWNPTRLPMIKLLTRQTRRLRITLRNDFRLYRSGCRSLGWCRIQSWRRRRSWRRKRCQHRCRHRRLTGHTHLETSKDLRHRKSSTIGWRDWSTVHRKLSPTRDDRCTTATPRAHRRVFFPKRGISVLAQRRFLLDNFEVHGYTFAATRIRVIVIARAPPLTGATDLSHVLVSEHTVSPRDHRRVVCGEKGQSACAIDCTL